MSERRGHAPDLGTVVAVVGTDPNERHRVCPLCTRSAVAAALEDPARQAGGANDMTGPAVLEHALFLAYTGAPLEIVVEVVLKAWGRSDQTAEGIVYAHFWEHGGIVPCIMQMMRTLRTMVRFYTENLVVSPDLDATLPVARLIPNGLKQFAQMRNLLARLLTLFETVGIALMSRPAPAFPADFPAIPIAAERYCVFCHGAHLRADTKEHLEAYTELMHAYTTEMYQLEHTRREMLGAAILARRGTQLLDRLWLPVSRDRGDFEDMASAHAYGHDESLGALLFAYRYFINFMVAFASARAANMQTDGVPNNDTSQTLRQFDLENASLVAEAANVFQLIVRYTDRLREVSLQQYSNSALVVGGPRFEVLL